ncbi:MAG TPA: xanthine dehydrogenase family protein molybdopterin-binding subunit [Chloroflexota bacterium]
MPTTSYMGGQMRRREDPRLITGSATYVDDIVFPGMLHMALLRSPYPHARILGIDVAAALEMPGVVDVATGREVADLIPPLEGRVDGEGGPPPRPPLAEDKARYIGDPVAAVVATSREVAADALERIAVKYEDLPGVGDAERAMDPGAPQIHQFAANNISERKVFTAGDPGRAFAEADVTISLRMISQRLSPNPIEPRGIVAAYQRGADSLTIWSSTQAAHMTRDAICEALSLPQTRVRAIAPEVGGGFGCKIGGYPEDILVAHFARKLNQPVKWIETRTEHLQATVHGRGQIAYIELAARRDGTITGLRLRLLVDSGAFSTTWLGDTTSGMITGCYTIRNVYTESLTVLTNKTPIGAYRGAGRPEAAYFIERGIDVLARRLGMDPAEVRRRNFIPPEAFPYELPDFPVFDSGEYEATMDTALERFEYPRMREEQERLRAQGRLVGIGMASYVEICGFGWETSTVRMEQDGTVSVYTGISPHGQGQETTFAQIAADLLGVSYERVKVMYGDTSMGSGFGTMGSRGTAVGGPAVHRAAELVRAKMRRIAAHLMEAAFEDLELEDGAWRVRGVPDRFQTVEEVARAAYDGGNLPEGTEPGLVAVNNFRPDEVTAPFGTHLVMVEVERDTGRVNVQRILTVDDCGTIISPQLVQGQVHGGIAQGLAQALFEEMVYTDDGQLVTGSFVDYAIPGAADLPIYETGHTNTPGTRNQLGIKGIGEAATIGSTPAVVNAVMDALTPLGIEHLDMPLTPFRVWSAISARVPAETEAVTVGA